MWSEIRNADYETEKCVPINVHSNVNVLISIIDYDYRQTTKAFIDKTVKANVTIVVVFFSV